MIGVAVSYCDIQGLFLSLCWPRGELLVLGRGFYNRHGLNQGSSSAPSTHHSAPGPDGRLHEQSAVPVATRSPQILLLILFTEWLSGWWFNQWLQT